MIIRLVRRWLIAASIVLLVGAAYVASPFVAAWTLREAIRANDVATIERKVVWSSVRSTLRASLAVHAQLLPAAAAAGEAVKPTLWQRIKSTFGGTLLDRFMDTYVTPEGLPKLFAYGQSLKQSLNSEPVEAQKTWHERAKDFFDRVRRAEFTSVTRIEIEMVDRQASDRVYLSTFELLGGEWKLTELAIIGPAGDAAKPRFADGARAIARPSAALPFAPRR